MAEEDIDGALVGGASLEAETFAHCTLWEERGVIAILVVIVHIIVALALILIVLLQVGKGGSLGAAFGGAWFLTNTVWQPWSGDFFIATDGGCCSPLHGHIARVGVSVLECAAWVDHY